MKVTLALLICSGCPVRRQCLTEALTEVTIDLDAGSNEEAARPRTALSVDGIRGGTTTVDRRSVSGLSRERAIAELERTFPARLQRHAVDFRRRLLAKAHGPNKRVRRILKLLAERRVAVTPRCEGCGEQLPALARSDARFCSVRCRVAAHRARAA